MGLSEQDAQIAASVSVAVFQLGCTIGGTAAAGSISNAAQGVRQITDAVKAAAQAAGMTGKEANKEIINAGMKALVEAAKSQSAVGGALLKGVTNASLQLGMQVGQLFASVVGTGGQLAGAITGYESMMAQADTTDLDAALKLLQQMMDETTEELNQLLSQVEELFGKMAGIISSSMETEIEISDNLGNMA